MASTAISQPAPFDQVLEAQNLTLDSVHESHLHDLASTILYNLQYQHDWTSLSVHTHSPLTGEPLSRPLVSGLPPRRIYVHPDEQIETLKAEHDSGTSIEQFPEREWVLPTQLSERWSLEGFSAIFDAVGPVPPFEDKHEENESEVGQQYRGENRQKRLLLATVHDDSTVVYYIMHDGLVKPRQN
jgi:tRNA-splicing endonuclease subunit Sen15